MINYNIGDLVRLCNIPDPSFPSKIGREGIIVAIQSGDHTYGPLYDVLLDNIPHACWEHEIELVDNDPDDLFADNYVPARDRQTIEQIMDRLFNEDAETTRKRHAKHTRKPRNEGPEAKVLKRVRAHLETHYNARVLRTNAGHMRDPAGHVINFGDPGQSDLHAIIPITINGVTFGIFAAIECKAGNNQSTDLQRKYLENVKGKGGIAVEAHDVLDVDTAIASKVAELERCVQKT